MEKWKFTPFGLEVRKKLLERHMEVKDLAEILGCKPNFLSAMLYGKKKGYEYIEPIKEYLEIS